MPLADEALVEAQRAHAVELAVELLAPGAQRACVVAAQVFEAVQDEATVLGEEVVEAIDREQQRAGEDVLLDEVDAVAELTVTRVGACDELQRDEPVALQHAVAHGGVIRQVVVTHGFEHFDGDDLVELAGDVAVVLHPHFDAVGESGGGDAPHREIVLLLRDGERGDAAAVVLPGVQTPAAPAGADLEDVIAGLQVELAAERVVLGDLRLLERRRAVPTRARIHHRAVEPEAEELVGEIVVLADIAPCDGARVGAQQVAEPVGGAEKIDGHGFRPLRAGERRRVFNVQDEPANDGREIGRIPVAVEVGLGEADVAVERAFLEKRGAPDADERVAADARRDFPRGGSRVAEFARGEIGQLDAQAAEGEAGELGEHGVLPSGSFAGSGRKVGGGGGRSVIGAHASGERCWIKGRATRNRGSSWRKAGGRAAHRARWRSTRAGGRCRAGLRGARTWRTTALFSTRA